MATQVTPQRAPGFVGLFNPLARRLLRIGPLLGPNALITIRGRKTGRPHTTPVALVALDGRRWVIGTFGETNWVRNLRAAGEATLTAGKSRIDVKAIELDVPQRTAFFKETLGPYARNLPVGPLLLAVLGAREILDDPRTAAEHRPVFELRDA
ncbi:MAG TPA: nitroreductase family deazaflavin-dependent oxidoreductase [Candidatus Dormibacteraeota bacterium]|nr:nitroreductase family deazaflavin-dependent oxidoreductase [Candidatus Dormibacteraeota bacterium]